MNIKKKQIERKSTKAIRYQVEKGNTTKENSNLSKVG
jgi:hypothetical protein